MTLFAQSLYQEINEKFRIKSRQVVQKVVPKPTLLVYPGQKYYLKIRNLNPRDKDSAIMLHWQLPQLSDEETFHLDIIMDMMDAPAFNQLRTEKELGYLVMPYHYQNGEKGRGGVFFYIMTQADKYTMADIYREVQFFVQKFRKILGENLDKNICLISISRTQNARRNRQAESVSNFTNEYVERAVI